jgi:hypothetical protein
VDPITVVTRMKFWSGQPWNTHVGDHIGHHGWGKPAAAGQHFKDPAESCTEGEISLATAPDVPPDSRWHARSHYIFTAFDPHISGASVAGLTPHWDQLVSACTWHPKHAVQQDYYGDGSNISGFEVARDELRDRWIDLPSGPRHHSYLGSADWRNTDLLGQCDQSTTQSDGWVYYFGLCPVGEYPC